MTPLSSEAPAALLSLSPPPSVAQAGRRPSGRRHSVADSDSEGEALDAKYGGGHSDDDGLMNSASLNAHRERLDKSLSRSKRTGAGRHSVAAGNAGNQMTLREQEQVSAKLCSFRIKLITERRCAPEGELQSAAREPLSERTLGEHGTRSHRERAKGECQAQD